MLVFHKDTIDMISLPKKAVELLLQADALSVKLYLYGLLHEQATAEEIMEALVVERGALLAAMEELQKLGLLSIEHDSGTKVVYQNIAPVTPKDLLLYQDASFNQMLQAIFSDRELSFEEYKGFYEIIDVYGLPRQVVLVLAEYCINQNKRGNRVAMAYIKKTAATWAKEEITTIEAAQEKVHGNVYQVGAAEILKLLNIKRQPTQEEQKLYKKWLEDWGFTKAAVKEATSVTTGAQYPTFRYLDGILKNFYVEDIRSAKEIGAHLYTTEKEDTQIKEFMRILGMPRHVVAPEHKRRYKEWQSMGFTEAEVGFACKYAVSRNASSFEYVSALLKTWKEENLLTVPQIERYLQTQKDVRTNVRMMLQAAGVNKRISAADENQYAKFSQEYGFGDDVILFAAGQAYGLNAPLKAMDTILLRWKEAGVKTLSDAQKQNEQFKKKVPKNKKSISDIGERSYAEGELSALIEDPFAEFREEK